MNAKQENPLADGGEEEVYLGFSKEFFTKLSEEDLQSTLSGNGFVPIIRDGSVDGFQLDIKRIASFITELRGRGRSKR